MPKSDSQAFLRELDMNGAERHGLPARGARRVGAGARIKLWIAADELRSNLDAAVYKHAVLGLIFLKYVSDSFAQRQAEIAVGFPPSGSASQTGLAGRQIEARNRKPRYAPT